MNLQEASLHSLPFADDFLDVESLNAHVSTRLVERIVGVRRAALSGERASSRAIAVLGAAGGGKTHLFARLRHDTGAPATPILLRPYFGVSLSLRDVLAAVIDQLCLPASGGDSSHLDLLCRHWVDGESEAALRDGHDPGTIDDVEKAVSNVVSLLPEVAPAAHLARAIFELRDRDRSACWAELAWLSGREPRPSDNASASPLSEGDVLHVLRILGVLAAPVAPLVITFDQLENLATGDEGRVLAYGNLVAEMVDTLPCLTIVQLALTSEWMQFIEPVLSLPQKTRVASDTLRLEAPTQEERELLLRAWHDRIGPRIGGRKKRFPYPLSAEDVETLLTAPGMTPRLLLTGLSRVISGKTLFESSPTPGFGGALPHAKGVNGDVANAWDFEEARVEKDVSDKERANLPFDSAELAEALASALSFVGTVEVTTRTERDRVQTAVRSPGHELLVLYLTSLHHVSVGATLAKAAELAQGMKVVIVREKRFDFPRTWGTVDERRAAFERLPNARWLWLERGDTVRWLTLARVLSQARAKRLHRVPSDEVLAVDQVRSEISRTHAPADWPSVRTLTSWLSDVPRDLSSPKIEKATTRIESSPMPSTPIPENGGRPEPSLGEWLREGRTLGLAIANRYAEKLRALRRR